MTEDTILNDSDMKELQELRKDVEEGPDGIKLSDLVERKESTELPELLEYLYDKKDYAQEDVNRYVRGDKSRKQMYYLGKVEAFEQCIDHIEEEYLND